MKNKLILILIGLVFLQVHLSAQTYDISTVAGIGFAHYSGDGGPATAAELFNPYYVAVDGPGNLYISDESNNRIRKVNTSGIITTIAGNGTLGFSGDGGQATAAEFDGPFGIAVDATGNIYVVDRSNQRVRKISISGIITTVAGNGGYGYSGDGGQATAAELQAPAAVAVDASGNIYIADQYNERIRKVNTAGKISTFAGNGSGNYSGDGGPATAAEINYPLGVAVDASGNVYIADELNECIRKVNIAGIISTVAGNGNVGFYGDGGAATSAELDYPIGVAIDASGNIYIGDHTNNRIRKVNSSGIISTIAGNGVGGFSGDGGPATAAELFWAEGVAVDALGNVYFGDEVNNRVRELNKTTTSLSEINLQEKINIYPNPNNGLFTLRSRGYVSETKVTIMIYNIQGEKIYNIIGNSPVGGLVKEQINLTGQPSGVYLYKVISNNGKLINEGKFILSK